MDDNFKIIIYFYYFFKNKIKYFCLYIIFKLIFNLKCFKKYKDVFIFNKNIKLQKVI